MNRTTSPTRKQPEPEQGVRPGVMMALLGIVLAVLIPVLVPFWAARHKPSSPPAEPVARAKSQGVKPRAVSAPGTQAKLLRPVPVVHQARVEKPVVLPPSPSLEDRWGIQVSAVRLSMADAIVDLRYKVIDPEKAVRLADGKTQAQLVERSTGKKLIMPRPPKEGAFPPTSNKLIAGKTYFATVANRGGILRSGSQVDVMIGDSLAANLTIE
jgi:hypothetical protein